MCVEQKERLELLNWDDQAGGNWPPRDDDVMNQRIRVKTGFERSPLSDNRRRGRSVLLAPAGW